MKTEFSFSGPASALKFKKSGWRTEPQAMSSTAAALATLWLCHGS
ncbi:MAG TPA: hypothetical protein VKH41_00280 [Myxococcota bacterium]|nr:hypothetical protein [Myxococcota bacterium]